MENQSLLGQFECGGLMAGLKYNGLVLPKGFQHSEGHIFHSPATK